SRDVPVTGPVALLATDSGNKIFGLKAVPADCRRRMACETIARFVRLHHSARGIRDGALRRRVVAYGYIQALDVVEEAYPAFDIFPVVFEDIGLPGNSLSKRPENGLGD